MYSDMTMLMINPLKCSGVR